MLNPLDYVVWKFLKFIVNSASRPFNLVQLYVVKAKSNVCFIFLYNAILYCFCKHEVNSYTLSLYSYLNTKSSGWYPLFGSCLMKMSQVFLFCEGLVFFARSPYKIVTCVNLFIVPVSVSVFHAIWHTMVVIWTI